MDLTTEYMGLKLKCPLAASASPLSRDVDNIKRLEDAGASAIVLYSLFEEQIIHEQKELDYYLSRGAEHFAEALTYYPNMEDYNLEPDMYLEHIRKAKEAVDIPIIGSLNGVSDSGWSAYASHIEQAGADAVELNIYYVAADDSLSAEAVESLYLGNLATVKEAVGIPVAVKVGPFFSAMARMAKRLDSAGADALVLFNRFYQPDINLETLETEPSILLSREGEYRLPLRWIAVLYGRIGADLAASSGIHNGYDAAKMIMAGADVLMLCSTLLKNGIDWLTRIKEQLREWAHHQEYASIGEMRGSMSHRNTPNPSAFERANYMRALTEFSVASAAKW
ncbi:MAG: dihydroorotate dehydrogenase-like protein [Desulfobacterales bacterium]